MARDGSENSESDEAAFFANAVIVFTAHAVFDVLPLALILAGCFEQRCLFSWGFLDPFS